MVMEFTYDWICETRGHLELTPDQISAQADLLEEACLKVTDAHK